MTVCERPPRAPRWWNADWVELVPAVVFFLIPAGLALPAYVDVSYSGRVAIGVASVVAAGLLGVLAYVRRDA